MATHGMISFTIQELAKEVGVSEGAIYRHFKSKDEILLALIQEIERTLLVAVTASERPKEGVLAQLKHLLGRHFSTLERRSGVSFVVISEALTFADPEVKQATRQMVERYLDMLDIVLKAGVERGEVAKTVDTRAAALMFFGMIQASVTLWAFNNRAHPLAQHSTALWGLFEESITTNSVVPSTGPRKARGTKASSSRDASAA